MVVDVQRMRQARERVWAERTANSMYAPELDEADAKQRPTQSDKLMDLAAEVQPFRTPEGDPYVRVYVGGQWQTWALRGDLLSRWLSFEYVQRFGKAPNANAVTNTVKYLEGKAHFLGGTREVYIRHAWDAQEEALYLDLGTEAREAVRVTADGWDVVPDAPVAFRRPNGMLPLPKPQRGGSLEQLRDLINVASEEDWVLLVSWLLGTLHPTGPYPVLALNGERGSAKSTTTRFLRMLVDPSAAPVHRQPKESKDLPIKAKSNWILAFDNMSNLPRWLSDNLCGLATGTGDSNRKFYAQDEEVIFQAKRPIILNGIEDLATSEDLMDRAVIVTLPVIREGQRRTEQELHAAFEHARPFILGALLDAAVVALRNRADTHLDSKPRMADFAQWVTAAEPALGWEPGHFLAAYTENRQSATSLEIEASPVARAVVKLMENRTRWQRPAEELLPVLSSLAGDIDRFQPSWPKTTRALSAKLTRVKPALRAVGIEVDKGDHLREGADRTRIIAIYRETATDTAAQEPDKQAACHPAQPKRDLQATPADGADEKDGKSPLFSSLSPKKKEEREKEGKLASATSGASGGEAAAEAVLVPVGAAAGGSPLDPDLADLLADLADVDASDY